jgi:hypothetical protein
MNIINGDYSFLDARRDIDDMLLAAYAALSDGDICEIGTSYGRGAAILAANTTHMVDTINPSASQMTGEHITHRLPEDEIGKFCKGISNVNMIRANSASLKSLDMKYDLVVVDGCHDYDMVVNDAKLAMSCLPTYIMFHDFMLYPDEDYERQVYKGVCDAIGDIELIYYAGSKFGILHL